jgi:hypothetical protein
MRVRRLTAGAVLAAAAAAAAGCDTADGPLRGSPPGESAGIINREPERFPTWHQGDFSVCLEDDGGSVTIEAIDPVIVGGVRLVAAGAKRMTNWGAGTGPGPFPDAYAPAAGYEVTARCSAQQ